MLLIPVKTNYKSITMVEIAMKLREILESRASDFLLEQGLYSKLKSKLSKLLDNTADTLTQRIMQKRNASSRAASKLPSWRSRSEEDVMNDIRILYKRFTDKGLDDRTAVNKIAGMLPQLGYYTKGYAKNPFADQNVTPLVLRRIRQIVGTGDTGFDGDLEDLEDLRKRIHGEYYSMVDGGVDPREAAKALSRSISSNVLYRSHLDTIQQQIFPGLKNEIQQSLQSRQSRQSQQSQQSQQPQQPQQPRQPQRPQRPQRPQQVRVPYHVLDSREDSPTKGQMVTHPLWVEAEKGRYVIPPYKDRLEDSDYVLTGKYADSSESVSVS
jgi:hypothetical protein